MISLVSRINEYIRHTGRILQLNNVCATLGLQVISSDIANAEHALFAGFFTLRLLEGIL